MNSSKTFLPTLFGVDQTDDYPSAEIVLTFEDGSTITASSHSYYAFMLPWSLENGAAPVKTFNANISRAVAALMENAATDRERLRGEGLSDKLAYAVLTRLSSRHP